MTESWAGTDAGRTEGPDAGASRTERRRSALGLRVGALIAVAGLLSGCAGFGGGSASDGSTGGGSTSAETSEYGLVRDGEFTFALSGQLAPFSFYENGKLTGFDVAIGTEVANRLKLKPNPSTGPFNTLLAGLQAGRYDAIVGSMTNTPERAKVADFSSDYYRSGAFLWVKSGSGVRSIDDLKDAVLGVPLGSTFEAEMKKKANVKEVKTYESDVDALIDVPTGRVDGAIVDKLVGAYTAKKSSLQVDMAGPALVDNSAAIPVRKQHEKLLAAINKALTDMKADGTYTKISQQWFGIDITGS
ncbi:ABC transporter substrate-binding protein [Streptosporangium violaceochromogenes]|nr:ABC transporter substrate-binding protein [Streptosporangium violaceochromogenes]